ncbi:MFS transporter [Marinobacterium jannaschii]|uniref:MFS transporter n=1 Tax=Marinobacterium jannaschii TaxID=64970 RepID=UPI0009FE27E1|nr:MFS transporter [Marinobacterium jannaschii]
MTSQRKIYPLGQMQMLIYALPALPLTLPTLPLYILLPTFYVEQMGLSLTLVGIILLLSRLLDMLSDPLAGYFDDQMRAPPHKLLMVIGAMFCTPTLLALVYPDQILLPPGMLLFLASSLLYLGWSLIQVPYITWLSDFNRDSFQRSRAITLRESFGLAGLLLSAAIPLLLIENGRSSQAALQSLVWLTLILGAVFIGLLLSQPTTRPPARQQPRKDLKLIRQNKLFVRLVACWGLNGMANGIPAVVFPLFISQVLDGDDRARALFLLLYFASAVLSLPLWLHLCQRYNKHRLWCLAMMTAISAFVLTLWVPAYGEPLFMLICLVTGAMLGADLTLPPAMQADVVDWDRYRYRRDWAGVLYGCWNMATKLALALAVGIALPLLELLQYVYPDSQLPLLLIYALLPCVLKAGSLIILWRFPLDRDAQRAVQSRLQHQQEG